MTVGDLIDYLQQFPSDTKVVLYGAEMEDDADYIALDCIAFD